MKPFPSWICAALVAAAAWVAPPGLAQTYPAKPITFVVPFPPGGSQDGMARLFGKRIHEELGQPVIVVNKPGAGGGIGALSVARAPADGYTFLVTSNGPVNIIPSLYKTAGYSGRDFAGVGMFFTAPFFLLVPASSPFKTVQELLEHGRRKNVPLNYGSTGSGNMSQIASEMINLAAGTAFVHIPYKGGAPLTTALIAGEVQWALQQSVDAQPQVSAGRMRPLAVLSLKRSEPWPQVPAMAELGIHGLETESWSGLVAPAGTPRAVIALMNQTINRILQEPAVAGRLRDVGATPGMPNNTPEGFDALLARETALFAKAIREGNIKAD